MFSPPKKLSDDEYVEKIRRVDRTMILLGTRCLSLAVAVVAFALVAGIFSLPKADAIAQWLVPGHKETFYLAILIGVFYGFSFAGSLVYAAHMLYRWHEARNGFRTERLLLKYYDELKKAPPPENTSASPPS